MSHRFRTEVSRVPAVRIALARGGVTTTVRWDGPGYSPSEVSRPAYRRNVATYGDPRFAGPLPTDRHLIPGTRTDFGSGDVSTMTSQGLKTFKALLLAARARQQEIAADMSKARGQLRMAWTLRALGWATLVSAAVKPVRESAQRGVALRRQELSTLSANMEATPIKVDFDMDGEVGGPQRRMHEAFDRITASQRKWTLRSTQMIDRVRARSAAGTVMDRKLVSLGRSADPLVDTSERPLAVPVQGGRATAYFYPGFVMVAAQDGSDFALVDLADLDVNAGPTQFVETEGVPGDAEVVGRVWAKSNKDGSRDRRFRDNSEIPLARYGEIHLRSPGGLNESLMVSRVEPCLAFAAAIREIRNVLASAAAGSKVAGRRSITDSR